MIKLLIVKYKLWRLKCSIANCYYNGSSVHDYWVNFEIKDLIRDYLRNRKLKVLEPLKRPCYRMTQHDIEWIANRIEEIVK